MKKLLLIVLLLGGGLFAVSCIFGDDDSGGSAYVRFTNSTGSTLSNISGGGATWPGPYGATTTEQKEVNTGNQQITWTCGGSYYSMYTEVDEGYWRLIVYECDGTDTYVVEE